MIQPPATLLLGPPGSGKTFSIPTYINAGIETFVIVTEPGGVESLLDGAAHYKIDISKLHWTVVQPATEGWVALTDMRNKIGTMNYEDLSKLKDGIGKVETRKPAEKLLGAFQNFKCERDGKEYGDVTQWGDDRALVLDSLAGLSVISWALTVGYKPTAHQGEWGIAMNFIESLLMKLSSDRKCFLTVNGHVEREMNELTGATQIMASTLGRKLAPKIPRFFSEVVLASRKKDKGFKWATIDNNSDLKNRALPISDDLNPSYVPIVEAYKRRLKTAGLEPSPTKPASAAPAKQPVPTIGGANAKVSATQPKAS